MDPYVGYHLKRPYDFRIFIEAYICTKRKYFHPEFTDYYKGLLHALEGLFGFRLQREGLTTISQKVFWMHFESTVRSLLQIATPWDGYQECSLLTLKLEECGEPGQRVFAASKVIYAAGETSATAHREMLYALFVAIFDECSRVVTSEELAAAGFDDSREPNIGDFEYDY